MLNWFKQLWLAWNSAYCVDCDKQIYPAKEAKSLYFYDGQLDYCNQCFKD